MAILAFLHGKTWTDCGGVKLRARQDHLTARWRSPSSN
jgi:hypothetical protein